MNMEQLLERAGVAREKAYAPYSKFKVGAALLTQRRPGVRRLQRRERLVWFVQLRGTYRVFQRDCGGLSA